ncbi:MAG: gliding motility lipoprotein GldH [Bacteroidales bacterium]
MIKGTSRYPLFLPLILIAMLTSSCGRNIVFSDASEMKGEKWKLDNVVRFEAEIEDTISSNNIFFTVRTGTSYPYRNIWLFVSTTAPSGKTATDTLQFMLADEKGNRYGKGFGDIRELRLPFRSVVYFPEKGKYQFSIMQGMRNEELDGVYDFGLIIEKLKSGRKGGKE